MLKFSESCNTLNRNSNTENVIQNVQQVTTKIERCLMEFLRRGADGIHTLDVNVQDLAQANQFDSIGRFWTSCLNSDVSNVRTKHGLNISSRIEPFISKNGNKAHFKRYWLRDRNEVRKAIRAVNYYRKKRGANPLTPQQCESFYSSYPAE